MLVLGRKKHEKFIIRIPGPDGQACEVMVCIVDVLGSYSVRVGIEAPREVEVLRKELVDGFAT